MPGLILSVAFVVYIVVRVKMNPSLAPPASFAEYRGFHLRTDRDIFHILS